MDKREKIIEFCSTIGLDTIGFTRCRVFEELVPLYNLRKEKGYENEFEEGDIEKRINPFLHFPEGKTIISIAFPYLHEANYDFGRGFSVYTMGRDYHFVVMKYLNMICGYIEKLGGSAKAFVDSNPLPERFIASLCGIGFIGKNNMLITEKYGSFVFLGEIITDLSLIKEDYKQQDSFSSCGNCNICLEACPTKAINKICSNANVCLSYITQKKHIEDNYFKVIGSRLFGCDSCQMACPHNEKIVSSKIQDFMPFEYMLKIDKSEMFSLNNQIFKSKYQITSCGWRGKNILQRNFLIYSFNNGIIPDKISSNSPYVIDYYNRLLSFYNL